MMGVTLTQLTEVLNKYAEGRRSGKQDFVYHMSREECDSTMGQALLESPTKQVTSAAEASAEQSDRERSPSPKIIFCGPVIKYVQCGWLPFVLMIVVNIIDIKRDFY